MQLQEEIIQLNENKRGAKSQFARVKNQLPRMLEIDTFDGKEINIVREKLNTTEEEVNKMLIELSDMYESKNNMEGMERRADEMEKLNEDYSDTSKCVQKCLDALREENGSHYSRGSRKSGQSVKSIQSRCSKKIEEVKQ